jgi:hypothetical protein
MTYEEFETAVLTHINTTWSETDATLIGEYYAKESAAGSTLQVSIGTEQELEAELGTVGNTDKRISILSGTANLLLSMPSTVGRTEALRLIAAARDLLHYKDFSGYGQFYAAIKRDMGTQDGRLLKMIVCPFTIEISE